MKDEELKNRFLSIPKSEIDAARKEATVRLAVGAGVNIRGLTRITYWDRIRTMAGYLSPWLWFAQAAVLLLGVCLFFHSPEYNYLGICSVLGPVIGCISCAEIQRTYYYGMWEVEKACRYDVRQVMLLKMQITGGIDLALVVCLIGLSAGSGVGLPMAVLVILVPYLLSSFVYFLILSRVRGRVSGYLLAGAGMLMLLGSSIIFQGMDTLALEFVNNHGEWIVILVILAADLLLWSMRRFFIYCDREEGERWNCV